MVSSVSRLSLGSGLYAEVVLEVLQVAPGSPYGLYLDAYALICPVSGSKRFLYEAEEGRKVWKVVIRLYMECKLGGVLGYSVERRVR